MSRWFASCVAVLGATAALAQDHTHHNAKPADAAQSAELQREIWLLTGAVARYRDFDNAKRDGWKRFGDDVPLMGEHWYRDGAPDPMPAEPLDFTMPSNLQYALINGKRELVGVSYVVRLGPEDSLPEGFDGDADHWHVHDLAKIADAATEERPFLGWLAGAWIDDRSAAGDDRTRLAMVHVWVTVPNPDGMFALHNRVLPYLRNDLPAAYADGASESAALGVDLAAANGCARALDGALWIAQVSRQQAKSLRTECARQATVVRSTLAVDDPAALNAAAENAWNQLQAFQQATLTTRQIERLATITDHGSH